MQPAIGSEAGKRQTLILRIVARVRDVLGTARALRIPDSEAHNLLNQLFARGVEGPMTSPVNHLIDEQGFITLANRAAASLSGYSRVELVGQPVDRLIPGSTCALQSGQSRSDRLPSAPGTRLGQELQALREDDARFWLTFDWNRLESPITAFTISRRST